MARTHSAHSTHSTHTHTTHKTHTTQPNHSNSNYSTHSTHSRRMTVTHNSHPYATSTSVSYNQQPSSSPIAFHADILSPASVNMAAGGTALSSPTTMSSLRKKTQPKSKNHGRFPCSIPGCFAVANHLSSMCRHKWGHLPQRLLPACRGHLPNGGPCPVRYQGRADTMKRHWLTHHTNEGPWVPDRYPPFEDLWKLVREGEVVLTPPSKYAYDSPPEQVRPLSAVSASGSTTTNDQSNGHIQSMNNAGSHALSSPSPSGNTNSLGPFLNPVNSGVPNRPSSASFTFGPGGRPNSFAGSSTLTARDAGSVQRRNSFADGMSSLHPLHPAHSAHSVRSLHSGQARISRGNLRPWKVSDPSVIVSNEYEEEYDELESDRNSVGADDGHEGLDSHDFQGRGYGDVDMMDAMDDDGATMEELSDQGGSPSHYSSARSHRSNSNPRSPASLHILHEHEEIEGTEGRGHHDQAQSDSHVQIHIPQVVLPPLTPLTQHERISSNMYPFRQRYPLVTNYNYNYTVMPTSNLRGTPTPTAATSSPTTVFTGANSAESRVGQENVPVGTGYVYGAKKGSPPGPGFTPASIPHSELSLLSHPPTDRILPSVNTTNASSNGNGWNGNSGLIQPHATVPTVASY